MAVFSFGPTGGPGGYEFNDFDSQPPPDNSRVFRIEVFGLNEGESKPSGFSHPEAIHGIQLAHITVQGPDVTEIDLPFHGANGGLQPKILTLNGREYIRKIAGTYKNFVESLEFTKADRNTHIDEPDTFNVGKVNPASPTFLYEAPTGFAIVGFVGRQGALIDALGVIIRPL